jgi:hypothetical protein
MNTPDHKPDDQLARRVLGRIDSEHLAPRPRWEFLLKNYTFWGLGALAVLFAALAFSATLFQIRNVDWRLSPATHPDLFSFFLATAPFFWVIALALFTLVGYLYVRRTTHGYRYSLIAIMLAAVLLSFVLGTILYATGLGGALEEGIGDHPPFYRPILVEERAWWLAPEKGLLGGDVEKVAPDESSFVLRDFSGQTWTIDTSDLRARDLATIVSGGTVRVIGVPNTATSSAVFHACFVFPWMMQGMPGHGPTPPPPGVIASTSAKGTDTPSALCQGIHPYQQLHQVEETW